MHRLIALRTAHCTQLSSQFSHTHPVTLTVPGVNWSAMSLHLLYLFYKFNYTSQSLASRGWSATTPSFPRNMAAACSLRPRRLFTTTTPLSLHHRRVSSLPPSQSHRRRRSCSSRRAPTSSPSPPQSPPVSPPWVLPPLRPLPNRRHLFTRRCLFIATCHPLFCTAQRLFVYRGALSSPPPSHHFHYFYHYLLTTRFPS